MKNNFPKLLFLLSLLLCLIFSTTCKKLEKSMLVSTGEVTTVSTTTAEISGSVVDVGDGATQHGHCYGTTPNVTISGQKTQLGMPPGTGGFTSQLTNLIAGTKYYVKAYLSAASETVYGNEISFTTVAASAPTLTTTEISSITDKAANSGGNITNDGGASVTSRGVCWSTSTDPTVTGNKTTDGTGTGSFGSNLTGLTASTTYYVRAYATNSAGTGYGNEVSFTTEAPAPEVPTLETYEISDISYNSASGGGNITDDGGVEVTDRGVCWNTSSGPTISDSKTSDGSGTGSFACSISGLTASTTYYVRAYARNSVGTAYGNEVTFTTSDFTADFPTLTTTEIASITQTTAVSGGNITDDGGASVIVRGVCWNTTGSPVIPGNQTSNGSGTGNFTSNITGLTTETKYYVRAYATNSAGTAYGNELTFTTNPAEPVVPTLSTTAISSITTTTALSGGNITSDGGALVTERGVCWSTSFYPTIANNKTSDGTGTGSFESNISGLSSNTTYYVRAYATNSVGTAYGSDISFTTANSTVTIVSSFAVPGSSPTAIEWDGESLWMIDNINNFYHLDTLGNILSSFAFHTEVADMAWDGEALWVSTSSQMEKIDTNGNILSVLPITYWYGDPLAWDGTYFWVADYNMGTVYKHDHSGNLILTFETIFFGHPTSMTYDGTDLLIGDSFEAYNNIYLYSKTGIEKTSINIDDVNLQNIKTFEKKAMAWDGKYLWYSSDARFEIYRLKIEW